jgi:formylglycine-generating enzyme required for sulfatase activity
MELVRIPAGSFWRGSGEDEAGHMPNEGPRRVVGISRPFHLAATETTVAQFAAFVAETGYLTEAERDLGGGFGIDFRTGRVIQMAGITWREPGFPGFQQTGRHPVLLVSWQDAEAFCRWLSAKEGRTYRLPTEAEWEYAARAGSQSSYWSGATSASLKGVANVADEALRQAMPVASGTLSWSDGFPFTAPVGSFAPNPLGLHDVHGNVWEWTSDWYGADAYAKAPEADPKGPADGQFRTIRGGGWLDGAARNRSSQRIYFSPTFRYCLLSGFRVLLEEPVARSGVGAQPKRRAR